MSVVFSGTNQGRFTSNGSTVIISLVSGVDWMWIKNITQSYATAAGQGVEYYWQLGMAQGRGTIYTKTTTTNALAIDQIAANAGFFLVDTTVNLPGPLLSLTGITGATPPVVETANTGSLSQLDVVRIFSTVGALQLGGLDFTIGTIVSGTSFALINMSPIANANPGAGHFRRIPYNPYFYPSIRYITNISQATQAIVTLSVTHNFTVGQQVRFVVPTVTSTTYGMTQLDGLFGNIVAIDQTDSNGSINTITVDIDTSGFTAFAFPLTTSPGFTPAQVIPVGENTAVALNNNQNILGDATINQGVSGIQLEAGEFSPAGRNGDVIFFVAGKSFSVDNE